jgi:N-acyl-D-aspartate/D-glutamate deacylase
VTGDPVFRRDVSTILQSNTLADDEFRAPSLPDIPFWNEMVMGIFEESRTWRFRADIGIDKGRIVAIGTIDAQGDSEIDARGAVVAPGFIDIHTHYDAQAFWDPMLSPSVFHGVTTVLAGNCGFTLAPLSGDPEDTDYLLRMLSRVEGMPLSTLRAAVKPDWRSFGEYLDKIDGTLAINTAFLVGHSALRRAVMGARAVTDKATPAEIGQMSELLGRSLAEGGVGFSTTIANTHSDYEVNPVPSRVASREEMVTLAGVAGDYPGHLARNGVRRRRHARRALRARRRHVAQGAPTAQLERHPDQ